MSTVRKARRGQTVHILSGEHEGRKAIALANGYPSNSFLAKLKDGPNRGAIITVLDGHYIVVGK